MRSLHSARNSVFVVPQPFTLALFSSEIVCFTTFFPHREAHFCHDDADTRSRSLYYLEAARSCRCENDAGVRQNHQSEKGRCRQSGKRAVRLVDVNRSIVECYKMVLFSHLHIGGLQADLGLL